MHKETEFTTSALNKPYYSKTGFDTFICDDKNKIYGVFDGMGTSSHAAEASQFLKETFETLAASTFLTNHEEIANTIDDCSRRLQNNYAGTTATVIHVSSTGMIYYAHCGDSRLYIHLNGRTEQITADEGVETILHNYVGKNSRGVVQLGYIEEWDKFMLCTDGVTGDRAPDLVRTQHIERIMALKDFENPMTAEDTAKNILKLSTKNDDKTIIVGSKNV